MYPTHQFKHAELKPLTKSFTDSLSELENLKIDRYQLIESNINQQRESNILLPNLQLEHLRGSRNKPNGVAVSSRSLSVVVFKVPSRRRLLEGSVALSMSSSFLYAVEEGLIDFTGWVNFRETKDLPISRGFVCLRGLAWFCNFQRWGRFEREKEGI
ncbi:hypothetical protein QYF36_019358 [Acer negundo]|nr:hypothetical protein QYF36_019358 [Acer negundo]